MIIFFYFENHEFFARRYFFFFYVPIVFLDSRAFFEIGFSILVDFWVTLGATRRRLDLEKPRSLLQPNYI